MNKNEANLVFAIGVQLLFRGVKFELEWQSKVGRHDIAILDEKRLYGIIEVKHIDVYRTSQIQRYESLGVPVEVAHWKSNIKKLVEDAKNWSLQKGIRISQARAQSRGIEMRDGKPFINWGS